jgi:hypothetical protein
VAEFKLELKSTTNLAEGIAHKVHRLWDRVKHPAYGLVDNASESPIRAWASIRSFKANALTIKRYRVGTEELMERYVKRLRRLKMRLMT